MFIMINRSLLQVFKQIGLTNKHAHVYELLLSKPISTPLQISRETKLNRSSIYRYLEDMRGKGLIELLLGDKSCQYQANPDGLNQFLLGEESRVEKLKSSIPLLIKELKPYREDGLVGTEVKYYQGVDGLRQMLWNVVSSKSEFMGLGFENWNTSVGKTYAEKLRKKLTDDNIKSREIQNDPSDDFDYTNLNTTFQNRYSHKAISPDILTIRHDTYIYADVFAYYYHYEGEYFGVEIHNKEIARTERQMFEVLWGIAK